MQIRVVRGGPLSAAAVRVRGEESGLGAVVRTCSVCASPCWIHCALCHACAVLLALGSRVTRLANPTCGIAQSRAQCRRRPYPPAAMSTKKATKSAAPAAGDKAHAAASSQRSVAAAAAQPAQPANAKHSGAKQQHKPAAGSKAGQDRHTRLEHKDGDGDAGQRTHRAPRRRTVRGYAVAPAVL